MASSVRENYWLNMGASTFIGFVAAAAIGFCWHTNVTDKLVADHTTELVQSATDAFLLGAGCEDLASCNLRIALKLDPQGIPVEEYVVSAGVVIRFGANGHQKGEKTVLPKECTGVGDPTVSDDGVSTPATCYIERLEVVMSPITLQQ